MIIDLSQLPHEVRVKLDVIFREDYELKVMQGIKRQTALAARNHQGKERSFNGRGPRVFEIDAMVDTVWRAFYGHNYTENEDLMRFLARRNPEIRVLSGGTKIMAGWMPAANGGANRFHKTYAEAKAA